MDDFFSKYGWLVVVGMIIVGVLLFMPGVTSSISDNINSFVTEFSGKVTDGVGDLDNLFTPAEVQP